MRSRRRRCRCTPSSASRPALTISSVTASICDPAPCATRAAAARSPTASSSSRSASSAQARSTAEVAADAWAAANASELEAQVSPRLQNIAAAQQSLFGFTDLG